MCTSVQAGSATSWTLLLGFESLRRETAGLVSNGSALGMQDREWAGETSNSLLKIRKGSSAYKLVTDESSGRFHFSQLFRKRKCAFSHELSLHFVKLKTNRSLLWLLRDSEWKKERRNSYTVYVQVEQTPPEAFTVWAGKMSWKKPKQAEFGWGHRFPSVSNGESQRESRPSLDRIQQSFSNRTETVTGLCTQIVSHTCSFYGYHLFARGFECETLRGMNFCSFLLQAESLNIRPGRSCWVPSGKSQVSDF